MSYELRWFLKGPAPGGLVHWAENRLGKAKAGSRTDYYFAAPESDHLGLKVRGVEGDKPSKVEVKWRNKVLPSTEFSSQAAGVLEDWSKLSWGASDAEQDIEKVIEAQPGGQWLAVAKQRRQWKAGRNSAGEWEPAQGRVERGLALEITALSVHDTDWWTFGFDVLLDDESDVVEFVRSGSVWLMKGYDGPPLVREDSYGYPKFAGVALSSR